jgi:hypothetical protein
MRQPPINPRDLTAAEWRRLHLPGNPSRIAGDPELRDYVIRCLETMSFRRAADACLEKFGAERAPRKSAIHRYWLLTLKRQPATGK